MHVSGGRPARTRRGPGRGDPGPRRPDHANQIRRGPWQPIPLSLCQTIHAHLTLFCQGGDGNQQVCNL
ncbi:hypothetical protein DF3PB_140027 [uncultured Defluviicoccus sp.]|uniref:Uncharacterized protein n=1 Tax=metagenome TaxID=256318 RepID=A0A380TBD0_9ZZZZ|nr:hypothetical protein DF3PB_140027 [uncultured Defluviicoccus sp.]